MGSGSGEGAAFRAARRHRTACSRAVVRPSTPLRVFPSFLRFLPSLPSVRPPFLFFLPFSFLSFPFRPSFILARFPSSRVRVGGQRPSEPFASSNWHFLTASGFRRRLNFCGHHSRQLPPGHFRSGTVTKRKMICHAQATSFRSDTGVRSGATAAGL
jgi:hypothetical protein